MTTTTVDFNYSYCLRTIMHFALQILCVNNKPWSRCEHFDALFPAFMELCSYTLLVFRPEADGLEVIFWHELRSGKT